MARILTIEDEENLRFSIAKALTRAGHSVAEADSTAEGWELTRRTEFDAVLTDVNLRGSDDGIDLVRRLREDGYAGGIVVMTAFSSIENAVRAMKEGADDYLPKPLSLEELVLLIERLLEEKQVRSRLKLFERMERAESRSRGVVGRSPAWLETLALAERLAAIPIVHRASELGASAGGSLPTILLLGETGTGKGVLARHIHRCGQGATPAGAEAGRKPVDATPMVHVNCSALPPSLVEAELFGHEKGAFTDAKAAREGLFEMADGGTVFLDEIGDMPLDLQAKILTVVEDGMFRRVGGAKDRTVRARIIAATNQDLEKRAQDGTFRRDLFYRLNAFTIRLPALRERADDAVLLAEEMLGRFAREYARPVPALTDDARRALLAHLWPGNVRELVNVMQRVAMLCDKAQVGPGELGLSAGPGKATALPIRDAGAAGPLNHTGRSGMTGDGAPGGRADLIFDFDHGVHTADEVERQLIVQALQRTHGNVSKAAKLIGMQRSSFRYRIDRFGLEGLVQEIARR